MKYAKPTVIASSTNGVMPKGSCWGHSCEEGEVFSCSNTGFSCKFGFSCNKYTQN